MGQVVMGSEAFKATPLRNGILAALPADEMRQVEPYLGQVSLHARETLHRAGEPIEYVYFPEGAVVSLLSVLEDGATVETAMVGQEGLVGLSVFHRAPSPTEQAIVQGEGTARRMSAESFAAAANSCPTLQNRVHRFALAQMTLTAQSSACDRRHSVVQRCARWLLIAYDRASSEEIGLTHLFLSQMLGVRRSSVTVAAESLRGAGAIEYTRGRVRVKDRQKLEALSCECYSMIRAAYARLLDPGAVQAPGTPSSLFLQPVLHKELNDEGVARGVW
jgi:CRP-like cAMP-binding protein